MSPATDFDHRQAFITGLQNLACYLASHPAVPVPRYGTEILLSAASTDDGGCAQVDRFARQLGVTPDDDLDRSGHYGAVRSFGPIGYRMTAISDHALARYHAETSYIGCVSPDPRPDTWT
jgi:hypothetical protein